MKDMGISDKYKKYDIDINKKNLEKLTKYSWFEKYFEMKFSDLFNYYIMGPTIRPNSISY